MRNPRTIVMANFDKTKAFIAFNPMIATKIGIKAFILSFKRSKTGKRSFFFNNPRAAVNNVKMLIKTCDYK